MTARPIYLDYMATTPIDPRVCETMLEYMGPKACFGNPASTSHVYGRLAAQAVERARQTIAACINADDSSIVFTSGATESDNLAIIGGAEFYQGKGKHLITLQTEHKAVLDSFHYLEKNGFEVTYLKPDASGLLSVTALEQAIRSDTILVSIMHVNNEIGVIQDISAFGQFLHDKGILFHVDAAQSAGKLTIDVDAMQIDLLSISAHKMYGPKGVGALYVRQKPRVRLAPMSFGGGHEGGMRSGTLATHQIVGMAEAFKIAVAEQATEQARLLQYREKLLQALSRLPNVQLNGDRTQRIAGNLNLCFQGLDGDALMLALRDLAVSSTSACASAAHQPSYVLKSIGLDDIDAFSSIRLSFGRFTSEDDVARVIDLIATKVERLYEISA